MKFGVTRAAWRAVAIAVSAIALGAPAAAAQDPPTAAVAGLVFDSTAMRPLVGARVAVMGTSAVGTTDEGGRFLLRDVPTGEYWISFFHPRLQELGVSAPPRQLELTAGSTANAILSVPSEQTLLLGWCLAEQPPAGSAAIAGFVTDSITGVTARRGAHGRRRILPHVRGPGRRRREVAGVVRNEFGPKRGGLRSFWYRPAAGPGPAHVGGRHPVGICPGLCDQ